MSNLFKTIRIGNVEIKNRLVMPPMCMYSADHQGNSQDFHLIHYSARAIGGIGLIILEATGVEDAGRITQHCLGLWNDKQLEGIKKIAYTTKSQGAAIGIQLAHAGRKCDVGSVDEIYAPSQLAFSEKYRQPKKMDKFDIQRVVEAFGEAAGRAKIAGFDIVEVHAAHGYLLSSFLSPLANKREDEYGGSYENRARILGEVVSSIKSNFNGLIIVRISAKDYADFGNRPEDLAKMINIVKNKGIDMLDISSGGVSANERRSIYPGYQLQLAETIKKYSNLPVIAGGLLTSPHHMEEIISNNRADMVYVGRELLRNPHFAFLAAKELRYALDLPSQYALSWV